MNQQNKIQLKLPLSFRIMSIFMLMGSHILEILISLIYLLYLTVLGIPMILSKRYFTKIMLNLYKKKTTNGNTDK